MKEYCHFICSNGAVICDGDGNILELQSMPREEAIQIAYDFWNRTDGRGEVNLASAAACHLMSRDLGMEERLKFIGNKYYLIQEPEQVEEEIVKVSVYLPDGAANYVDRFLEKWKQYNPAIAGPYWIDTTLANKGTGVERLAKRLNLQPDEIMAFGDNYNDVSMLDYVGHPYIMESATEELRNRYANHTTCVEDTIDEFLSKYK